MTFIPPGFKWMRPSACTRPILPVTFLHWVGVGHSPRTSDTRLWISLTPLGYPLLCSAGSSRPAATDPGSGGRGGWDPLRFPGWQGGQGPPKLPVPDGAPRSGDRTPRGPDTAS